MGLDINQFEHSWAKTDKEKIPDRIMAKLYLINFIIKYFVWLYDQRYKESSILY